MSMQDTIADMLTRIRNAIMVKKPSVSVPYSTLKEAIVKILSEEGFIESFEVVDLGNNKKEINVVLKYFAGKSVIEELKRVSVPSLRVYKSAVEIPKVQNGLGIAIISTSKGVMTDAKARELNLGGEVLCYVS